MLGIAWYFKEVVYLFVALFLSARLNEIADELRKELGDATWESSLEMLRLQVFTSLVAKPVSFKLLGTRPTMHSVAWQCASVVIALVLGFAKGLLYS